MFELAQADAVEWLRSMKDECVDLVVTDPAYESLEKHRAKGTTTRLKVSAGSSNEWFSIFPNARFPEFFAEVYRVLKKDTHFYMYCDQETMFHVVPLAQAAGFTFWKPLIWDKACVSDDTEALTRAGWKRRVDLAVGEEIVCIERPKHRMGWAPIQEINGYPVVDEPMVRVQSTMVDMLLTGNHRIYVRGREEMQAVEFLNLKPGRRWLVPVGAESHLQGRNGHGRSEAIAELRGWYVAEGTKQKSGAVIYQKKPKGRARIRKLLKQLGWKYTECPEHFYISKESAGPLREYGKRIIRETFTWSLPEAQAFFDGLVGGDGSKMSPTLTHFWQKDQDQIDLFQELALRLGYSCNVRQCKPKLWWSSCRRSNKSRWTGVTQKNVSTEKYTGMVWCPTVETGYWLARRNGKQFITGNSIGLGYHYRCRYECILFFEKGRRKLNDLGIPDIITWKRVHGGYPTEKPSAVSQVLIKQSSKPGEIVCDPFMGSGSVGHAALWESRQFIGCDLSERAVTLAQTRLEGCMAAQKLLA
jgi:DNA modification methylase